MAQSPSLKYPPARRADVIDDYFGTKVADPYRWMEDLDSPELKQWVDAENALAFGYFNALPQRDALKARITSGRTSIQARSRSASTRRQSMT